MTDVRPPASQADATAAEPAAPKPGLVDRLKARYQDLRGRFPFVDHVAHMFEHFGREEGSTRAGAATYYGLLSFFPIVALIYAVLGFITQWYPDIDDVVIEAMRSSLPGIFDQLDSEQLQSAATAASIFGILGFLYAGLGCLSAMRNALQSIFAVPKHERSNMVTGKLFDLLVLVVLGTVLLVSVACSTFVTKVARDVLGAGLALQAVGVVFGILSGWLLFFLLFRVLGRPSFANGVLWQGALLAAVGFEVLKLFATWVIGGAADNPIYGVYAIIIVLVIWISYFVRLTLLGASWAATSRTVSEVVVDRLAGEAERELEFFRAEDPEVVAERERAMAEQVAATQARAAAAAQRRDRDGVIAGAALGASLAGALVAVRRWLDGRP